MNDATADGARILGSLRSVGGQGVVRLQDRFDTDVDDLWSALTDPARLSRWLGEVEGDLHLGGQFRAFFFATGWEGTGRVTECEAPRRLLVLTAEEGDPGEHAIEVTLSAEGEQTVMVVEERGIPADHLAAYGAGMQVHVEDLGAHLLGGERGAAQPRWTELLPSYQGLPVAVS